jgi:hypothetical protein
VVKGVDVAVTGSNGSWRRVAITGWIHESRLQERARKQGATPGQTGGALLHASASITLETSLLAAPRGTVQQAERYLLARPHGEYSEDDVRRIVRLYFETAASVGLDPLLVIAQLVLETGHLTSFWSQRPRRNPAGIGVTGAVGEGLSFPDWDTAVRAHVGRSLAYALHDGAENPAQSQLIAEALSFRPLPAMYRGAVRKLGDLGHGVWAADNQYAAKLVQVANDVRGQTA